MKKIVIELCNGCPYCFYRGKNYISICLKTQKPLKVIKPPEINWTLEDDPPPAIPIPSWCPLPDEKEPERIDSAFGDGGAEHGM